LCPIKSRCVDAYDGNSPLPAKSSPDQRPRGVAASPDHINRASPQGVVASSALKMFQVATIFFFPKKRSFQVAAILFFIVLSILGSSDVADLM
jgi:hypothetical protein